MHAFVENWARDIIDKYRLNNLYNVLEIGSQNVNGSLRPLFNNADYLGVDIQEGPGVDRVISNDNSLCTYFETLNFYGEPTYEQFDVIVCTEALEHIDNFWMTLWDIRILLKPGGYLILTARGCRANGEAMFEHSYPHDYFRFMPQSWPVLAKEAGCEIVEAIEDQQHPGFCLLGKKIG